MKFPAAALCALALMAACAGQTEGPIFSIADGLYPWVEAPTSIDPQSENTPQFNDPTVTFALAKGDRRSTLRTGDEWRIGQSYLIGFDIKVDPARLAGERVVVSQLVGSGPPEAKIAAVELDAKRGVTVFGRQCIPSEQLAEWHRVEMRIKLSNGDTGYLEVFCDRKPVWARMDIRTTQPPVCRLREGCTVDVAKPARFEWRIGLMSKRPVRQPVRVDMRKLHQREIFYVPNRVGTL